MSTNHDLAFERLRRAKPDPVTPVPARSAAEFLDELEDHEPEAWLAAAPDRRSLRPLLAAAVVVFVVGAAVGLTRSTNSEPPVVGVATSTEVAFNVSAAELPSASAMLGGEYRSDKLGTPISMDLQNVWFFERHEAGVIALSDEGSLSIIRPTGLADLTEPGADGPMFTWPPSDLDGWLDSAASLFTTTEATNVGRDGLRVFDVQVADGVCSDSTACVPFLTSGGTYDVSVGPAEQTRVWWFTMEPFAPIVVVATGPASTIQNAEALVRSMGFGPPAEHPLAQQEIWEAGLDAELPAGRVALPALGGVEFDLPSPVAMRQSDDAVLVELTSSIRLAILIVDRAADGTPVTTVAEATAAIDPSAQLTPAGSLQALLGQMQVVDVSDGPTTNSAVALLAPGRSSRPVLDDDGFGWLVPRSGRLWMIEVENGVLLVSAEVLEDSALEDPTLGREVIELGEAVARTISLAGA